MNSNIIKAVDDHCGSIVYAAEGVKSWLTGVEKKRQTYEMLITPQINDKKMFQKQIEELQLKITEIDMIMDKKKSEFHESIQMEVKKMRDNNAFIKGCIEAVRYDIDRLLM